MNFNRILYFLEAAKCMNFTAAATQLYTTQPNLSRQIARLEEELGFSLFSRVNKMLRLTPAGEFLYEKWKHIPGELDRDVAQAYALARESDGIVTIGVLENIVISSLFEEMQKKIATSNLKCRFECDTFLNLRQGLESFRYRMILTLSFDLMSVDGVCTQPIQKGEIGAIFISKSNPLSQKQTLTLADMQDEPFVAISPAVSRGGYELLLMQCDRAGFTPNIVRTPSSLETLLFCVETGEGATILDRSTRLESSNAVEIFPLDNGETIDVVAAWRKNDSHPSIDVLVNAMGGEGL